MAIMHEKTFEIYHNDQHIIPDGYVEIDELIAPSIQTLNRKGYITEMCCSGHSVTDWLINGEAEYWQLKAPPYSYILFKEGIYLPVLPRGFVMDSDNTLFGIRKNYTVNSFFETSRNILETMEQLYEWALDLPDFTG